jgi:hypothetical protein
MSSLRSVEFKNGGVEEIAAALIGMVLAKRSFIPDPEGRALAMIQRIADSDIRCPISRAPRTSRKSTHRDPALMIAEKRAPTYLRAAAAAMLAPVVPRDHREVFALRAIGIILSFGQLTLDRFYSHIFGDLLKHRTGQ